MPKWSQNRSKIDTKTHQESMPKLITEKIRKVIKNHVSLNGKIIEVHWKNTCFWWFRKFHVRTGKVSTKLQKWDRNPSQNLWKVDTKIMLEKGITKTLKTIKTMFENKCEPWEKMNEKHAKTNWTTMKKEGRGPVR